MRRSRQKSFDGRYATAIRSSGDIASNTKPKLTRQQALLPLDEAAVEKLMAFDKKYSDLEMNWGEWENLARDFEMEVDAGFLWGWGETTQDSLELASCSKPLSQPGQSVKGTSGALPPPEIYVDDANFSDRFRKPTSYDSEFSPQTISKLTPISNTKDSIPPRLPPPRHLADTVDGSGSHIAWQ